MWNARLKKLNKSRTCFEYVLEVKREITKLLRQLTGKVSLFKSYTSYLSGLSVGWSSDAVVSTVLLQQTGLKPGKKKKKNWGLFSSPFVFFLLAMGENMSKIF